MAYRTRTYIAADWTSDKNAIEQSEYWNNSEHIGLSFKDTHEFIVLYNSATLEKSKCIDIDKAHTKMIKRGTDNKYYWDYQSIKAAFEKLGD